MKENRFEQHRKTYRSAVREGMSIGRLITSISGLVVLCGLFCLVGLGQTIETPQEVFFSDVKAVANGGSEVVLEGVVRGGTMNFFCCVGYPYALDNACGTPKFIYGSEEIDLRDYVGSLVRIRGHVITCPPRALCACRVDPDPDIESVGGADGCVSVQSIELIDECTVAPR